MLERALVGGAARETIEAGTKYALPKAIAKGALGEGAQEFVEEGGGRLAANIAAQNYADPSHDTWDQVGENAGMGAAGGLLMGELLGRVRPAEHEQERDQTAGHVQTVEAGGQVERRAVGRRRPGDTFVVRQRGVLRDLSGDEVRAHDERDDEPESHS